jgi:hypothetical protein
LSWLFFLSRFDCFLCDIGGGDSTTGLDSTSSTGVAGSEGAIPIFLRISSLGEMAISLSSALMVLCCTGLSFGTARRIVPSGIFGSAVLLSLHLFPLDMEGVEVGGGARAKLMLAMANV